MYTSLDGYCCCSSVAMIYSIQLKNRVSESKNSKTDAMLRSEPAIANAGAVVVEIFAIMMELMIGIVVVKALCAQRYDKDERLNRMSFAEDIRKLSTAKMTDYQFNRKLIRYARYALMFQWISYLICHILILTHEFMTEPDFVDHLVYISFIINLTFLFLVFRNIGIYYFLPFTDEKNFPNPLSTRAVSPPDTIYEDDDVKEEAKEQTHQRQESESEHIEQGHQDHHEEMDGRRYSHHHYDDPDLMPNPSQMVPKTGNEDYDAFNAQRLDIRINFVHIFRSVAYTTTIYWVGYVIAAVHGTNNIVLATIALAGFLYMLLVGAHIYYVKMLMNLLEKYQCVLTDPDDECDKRRAERLFQLDRWFRADVGIIIVLIVMCAVLLVGIATNKTSFAWPASHPVFLATSFAIVCSCQMTCCRYIWLTKSN
eukprot:248432_1